MLTILAILVVLICFGIAAFCTLRVTKLHRMNVALLMERRVLSEKLTVLEGMMARNGRNVPANPEAKLVLARNYLKGLRSYVGI